MAIQELDYISRKEETKIQGIINPETGIPVPEFDLRNLDHHEEIATRLAGGERAGMFAGIWGGFKVVKRNTVDEGFFHDIKEGRPKNAKITMLARPVDSIKFIDWSQVHPDFRHLSNFEEYRKLWSSHGSYLHVIAPLRDSLRSMPDVFKTTPDNYAANYPDEPPIPTSTACFFSIDDPYIHHLATYVSRKSRSDAFFGATSMNPHGVPAASSYEGLQDQIAEKKLDPAKLDLLIRDSWGEKSGAFGSHTQIRLPFANEEPKLKVIRVGVLSPDFFTESTGLPIEVMPWAKDVRARPGVNIDEHIIRSSLEVRNTWAREQPSINFRK